ncbi:MAG: bacillithiol system redox-active protein YtxJ [Planctomycetota bacterium]
MKPSFLLLACALPAAALPGCADGHGEESPSPVPTAAAPAAMSAIMKLPEAPADAAAHLQAASKDGPIAVFKHSPICPVSASAQHRFHTWMKTDEAATGLQHAQIDVIAEKPLARGLVAELGVQHESPQLLLFHGGELIWHASHGAITGEALTEQLAGLE